MHFDDYFYPYPVAGQAFDDDADLRDVRRGLPGHRRRADWRRHNIDLLVRGPGPAHQAGQAVGEASASARSRSGATRPPTRWARDTTAGAQTYDDLYADTRRWVREEWLDYIAPQVYWNIGFAAADYGVLVPWWADQVRGTDVQLYVGQATYKVGTSTQDPRLERPGRDDRHLAFNRDGARGRRRHLLLRQGRAAPTGSGAWTRVRADHYRHPAIVPVTAGVPGHAPRPVTHLAARRTTAGVAVTWRGSGSSYAVYRVAGRRRPLHARPTPRTWWPPCTPTAAAPRGTSTGRRSPGRVTYVVTALDRAYRESRSRATHRCCTNRP